MSANINERLLNKDKVPSTLEIENFLGKAALKRLNEFEAFLKDNYDMTMELKFPFGNNYGWGYKHSCKYKLLCYIFFEKDAFTATITIGKAEVKKLLKELENMLPKTQKQWENRYPCGEGGWMHYRVENQAELEDIKKLITIKRKPTKK